MALYETSFDYFYDDLKYKNLKNWYFSMIISLYICTISILHRVSVKMIIRDINENIKQFEKKILPSVKFLFWL